MAGIEVEVEVGLEEKALVEVVAALSEEERACDLKPVVAMRPKV